MIPVFFSIFFFLFQNLKISLKYKYEIYFFKPHTRELSKYTFTSLLRIKHLREATNILKLLKRISKHSHLP